MIKELKPVKGSLKKVRSPSKTNALSKIPDTGKQIALQNLKASELQFRRLFEAAQDGILILDGTSGLIIEANQFIMDMLGYSRKELIGRSLWEIGENYRKKAISVMKTCRLNQRMEGGLK
jgi:PAS domain-containing protein